MPIESLPYPLLKECFEVRFTLLCQKLIIIIIWNCYYFFQLSEREETLESTVRDLTTHLKDVTIRNINFTIIIINFSENFID